MSRFRRSSVTRQDKDIKYGPNGNRICRQCEVEVKPPRRTICSKECLHQWKLRSSSKYLRQYVYQRDLGICAFCSVDTRYTKISIENVWREFRLSGQHDPSKYQPLLNICGSLNITTKESVKSLWHADHIIEVYKGGGETGLENIRTLCIACHKARSKGSRKTKK